MRKQGFSITAIEKQFGIARSTLSGWFRKVELTDEQKAALAPKGKNRWSAASREKATEWHNAQKQKRLKEARDSAHERIMDMGYVDKNMVEIAVAMLYLGEGSKDEKTSLGNSNPAILQFFVISLIKIYNVPISDIKCELHLRYDQDEYAEKRYWSGVLKIPMSNFLTASFDKRTIGRPTREGYHGVCIVRCGRIAIMRKLVYLSNMFCGMAMELLGD